jgi:hypothetical protein
MYGHFIRFGFATKTIGERGSPLRFARQIKKPGNYVS